MYGLPSASRKTMFVDPDLQSLQASEMPLHQNLPLNALIFSRIR